MRPNRRELIAWAGLLDLLGNPRKWFDNYRSIEHRGEDCLQRGLYVRENRLRV